MHNVIAQTHAVQGMPDPEVGMGVTQYAFSDRNPYTIVKVISPGRIVVQADGYKRTDNNGMSDDQGYTFSRNPQGMRHTLTRRRNGWWIRVGDSMKYGMRYGLGSRDRYYDFTF